MPQLASRPLCVVNKLANAFCYPQHIHRVRPSSHYYQLDSRTCFNLAPRRNSTFIIVAPRPPLSGER